MPTADWDPRAPETLRDQRAAYDNMRERCPVAYSDFLGWSLFRHEDVTAVLADPATFRSASRHRAIPNGMDPPEHTLYRHALTPFFDVDQMADFELRCRALASELVETVITSDDVEFVGEFAEPFSLQAQCAFLGWPTETWEHLLGWMHGNQEAALSRDRAAGKRVAEELAHYVDAALRARRTAGSVMTWDRMSQLMAIEVDGQPLSDDDLVSILRNWVAGHGTVTSALGILVFHLANDQELQQRIRQEPALIPAAIDEILRVDGPLVANRRTAAKSVEIGDRAIQEGDKLTLMWIAADRDEQTFGDATSIQLDRDQRDNLLFGAGIHDCVGAPLARLELRVSLEELLARTTAIELVSSNDPIRSVYPGNGFTQLPIRLVSA